MNALVTLQDLTEAVESYHHPVGELAGNTDCTLHVQSCVHHLCLQEVTPMHIATLSSDAIMQHASFIPQQCLQRYLARADEIVKPMQAAQTVEACLHWRCQQVREAIKNIYLQLLQLSSSMLTNRDTYMQLCRQIWPPLVGSAIHSM